MRILQVIDHLGLGGAQSMLVGLARLLSPDGFELSVLSLRGTPDAPLQTRLRAACRDVVAVDVRGLWDPRGFAAAASAVRRLQPDVVHTHLSVADVVGGSVARALRRPVVATLHSVAADRRTHPTPRRLAATYATRHLAHRLVAVSDAVLRSHVEELGVARERIQVIPNAPIAPLLLPGDFDREGKRRELGVGAAKVVSVASRLVETKGHHTLLHALPPLLERHPDLLLLVAGDGPMRVPLEALARDLGVASAVRFLGPRGDAVELMAASDVFCNVTSADEGLPIAALDALALGVPLVATETEGLRELLGTAPGALLVPERDVAALRAGVAAVLDDREYAARLASVGRGAVTGAYAPEAWAGAHAELYRSLRGRAGPRLT